MILRSVLVALLVVASTYAVSIFVHPNELHIPRCKVGSSRWDGWKLKPSPLFFGGGAISLFFRSRSLCDFSDSQAWCLTTEVGAVELVICCLLLGQSSCTFTQVYRRLTVCEVFLLVAFLFYLRAQFLGAACCLSSLYDSLLSEIALLLLHKQKITLQIDFALVINCLSLDPPEIVISNPLLNVREVWGLRKCDTSHLASTVWPGMAETTGANCLTFCKNVSTATPTCGIRIIT